MIVNLAKTKWHQTKSPGKHDTSLHLCSNTTDQRISKEKEQNWPLLGVLPAQPGVRVRQKYHKLSQQKVSITLRFAVRPVRPSSRTPTRQLFWPCIVEASWPTKYDPPKCSGFGNQVRSNERTQIKKKENQDQNCQESCVFNPFAALDGQ